MTTYNKIIAEFETLRARLFEFSVPELCILISSNLNVEFDAAMEIVGGHIDQKESA